MQRIPLLTGSRIAVVTAPDDALVLRPPPPGPAVDDVGSALRDALRFPLAGEPLEALAPSGGRATVVVEPPALPIPSAERDPRQDAVAAAVDELERLGIPTRSQTILVAGGLARRVDARRLDALFSPEFARRFHGTVEVHDVERDDLVEVGEADGVPLRVHPALVETDVVLTVTNAESVLDGGPAALVRAAGTEALRALDATSLLETGRSAGWRVAVELERAIARRVPLIGASLVLNHPILGGALRGFPYEQEAVDRVARSPARHLFTALPAWVRGRVLQSLPLELTAAGAFAGPPSVAHAEALLRVVELRSVDLDRPLDALCIGIPRATPYLPRERPNPLLVAYLGLALALRLWRDAFPIVPGGTLILVHRFHRHFSHPTQQPYRSVFAALRTGGAPQLLSEAERTAATDTRGIEEYRAGRACHPVLPFRDWAACRHALDRLGSVLIAGCRDDVAARQLGFVPVHGITPALAMARGRAGGDPRIGFMLPPP
ncbi:MAG: lactate racemase, partial [Gaiellaceae bacterium]|nr:lactate racemase [Gaiellaceae bacterium]